MTVSHYKLTETFEIIRVHPERDSILDLREAAGIYSDEDCTWTVEGSCVVFKRPLGSSLVPMADPS